MAFQPARHRVRFHPEQLGLDMTNYPSILPSLTRVPDGAAPFNDGSPTDGRVLVNSISDEVEAVAAELGVNPSGTYTTVAQRLASLAQAGYVNVRDYGAVGDGVNDDTSAFTAALAAGARVFVPAGSYLVGDVLISAGKRLEGEHRTTTTLVRNSATRVLKVQSDTRVSGFKFTNGSAATAIGWDTNSASEITDVVIEDNEFSAFSNAIYIDRGPAAGSARRWTIRRNIFTNCSYGVYSIRVFDSHIESNYFTHATAFGRHIFTLSGSNNRIRFNRLVGGIVGIGFLYDRDLNGFSGCSNNVVHGNMISGHSEEGISFDVYGNVGLSTPVIDNDTVASKTTVGGYKVNLSHANWASSGSTLSGYSMMFVSGGLAGRVFTISNHTNSTFTLAMSPSEHASIAASDKVAIGVFFLGNVVSNNTVDASSATTTLTSILLYGNCARTSVIGNTTYGGRGVEIRALNSITQSSLNVTGTLGIAPCPYNTVTGNTADGGEIKMSTYDYGSGAAFDNVGNKQAGNAAVTISIDSSFPSVTA